MRSACFFPGTTGFADIIKVVHPPDRREPAPPASPDAQQDLESLVDQHWLAWYLLSPMERWNASQDLWSEYLALGGSLEPEIDSQSPFFDLEDMVSAPRSDSKGGPTVP